MSSSSLNTSFTETLRTDCLKIYEQSHTILEQRAFILLTSSSLPHLTLTHFFSFAACAGLVCHQLFHFTAVLWTWIWEIVKSTELKVIGTRWENPDHTTFATKHMKIQGSSTERPSSASENKQVGSPFWSFSGTLKFWYCKIKTG